MSEDPALYEHDLLGLLNICPECRAGKHANCVAEALDPITDDFVPCLCSECAR